MPKKNYMYILYLTQLNVINKILMEGEKKKRCLVGQHRLLNTALPLC